MYPEIIFGGFEGEDVKKYCVLAPKKTTTVREYASDGVSHVKIGSTAWTLNPWKDFAYKERNKKRKNEW